MLDSLAQQGNTKAQFYFAQLCYSDSSTKEKQALYWIKSMGSQGNALACQYTARAYWKGLGTSKNSLKAKDWFLKAYAMGDPDSLSFLGKVLEEDQKPLEAVAAYELAYQKYKSKEAGYRLKEIKSNLTTISEDTIAEKISILRQRVSEINDSSLATKQRDKIKSTVRIVLEDGSTYQGKILDGKPHGYGKKLTYDGQLYIGDFHQGIENGYGTLFSKKGTISYQGLWKEGSPQL